MQDNSIEETERKESVHVGLHNPFLKEKSKEEAIDLAWPYQN